MPASEEFFFKEKTGKYGLKGTCKKCKSDQFKKYYQENKNHISDINKVYSERNKENILKYNKELYKNKKDLIRKHQKEYYLNNREKILSQKRNYIKLEDTVLKRRKNEQTREAKKRNLEANLTQSQWVSCEKNFGNKCCYCGKIDKLSQDHFIPISSGGEYTVNNIVPACKSCNSSKGNRNFFEWYPKQLFYSKKREKKVLKYLNYDPNIKTQQLALTN